MLIGAICAMAATTSAQQAPDPAPTASETPRQPDEAVTAKANAEAAAIARAQAAAAPPAPSREARKKAREYGFRAETVNGKTVFCKVDAPVGTRFVFKRCMESWEFDDYATQLKIARDAMTHRASCSGGSICDFK
jgi:hypothetical protein